MRKLHRVLVLPLALSIGVFACGGDSTGPEEEEFGSFSVTISGLVTDSFEGEAVFGEATDPDTNEEVWVLWLTDESEEKLVYLVRLSDRPGNGTYPFSDLNQEEFSAGDLAGLMIAQVAETSTAIFSSTGGSLVVTGSSSTRMEGTFTIQAEGIVMAGSEATEGQITITGEFDAVNGTIGGFPGT